MTTITREQHATLASTLNLNTNHEGKLTINPWAAVDTMLAAAGIGIEKTAEEKIEAFVTEAVAYDDCLNDRQVVPTADDYNVLFRMIGRHLG